MPRRALTAFSSVVASLALAAPAYAHHPMGGTTPTTFTEGLLSGFGHPVLGLDHLAALVVVGLLASRAGKGWYLLPSLWIAAMGAGDEYVQSFFPYRGASVRDWAVDVSAAIVASSVMALLAARATVEAGH